MFLFGLQFGETQLNIGFLPQKKLRIINIIQKNETSNR